ncbi:hypothetical protein GE21DRAFT_1205940, partial [Neurospora crassa]
GLPLLIVVNSGSEFRKDYNDLLMKFNILFIRILLYNSKINRVNKFRYFLIIIVFVKFISGIGIN